MSQTVFLSHSSKDKAKARKLYDQLSNSSIDIWASFNDIEPGFAWNQAIEEALESATHVIILVSKHSIVSEYVLAEIEFALNGKKVVIPLMFEEVKLPMRWHTLQHLNFLEDEADSLQKLVNILPKNSRFKLDEYLTSNQLEQVKDILEKNPHVLSLRGKQSVVISGRYLKLIKSLDKSIKNRLKEISKSRPPYHLETLIHRFQEKADTEIRDLYEQCLSIMPTGFNTKTYIALLFAMKFNFDAFRRIDFLVFSPMSAMFSEIIILADPTQLAFTKSGKMRSKIALYIKDIEKNLALVPQHDETQGYYFENHIILTVYSARRIHYENSANQQRASLESFISNQLDTVLGERNLQVSIPTYDRLLDAFNPAYNGVRVLGR